MKKYFLLFSILLFSISVQAQTDQIAPTLTKAELIDYLQDNYSVTDPLGYNSARDAMYGSIDNKNGDIVCVYTGFTIQANTRGDAFAKGINTEHTWPQGMFGEAEPMRGDIHHLFPTLVEVNSERSSDPFGEIPDNETTSWWYLDNKGSQTSIPTSNIDLYSEEISGRFEPREDHKGNVARAIFYFWAIYQNTAGVSDDASFFDGMKDVLLDWHDLDPVDAAEVQRSLGAESAQGNRNPFVHDTTLVRRAFFDGGVIEPVDVPNPVIGEITNIQENTFQLTFIEDENQAGVLFSYDNELVTSDTAGNPFSLADFDSIKSARVRWSDGASEGERIADSLFVLEFFPEVKDTIITGPTASIKALVISGVIDADLSGGTPKAVELYATEDIPDLGVFAIGSANNGGGSNGVELQLSGSLAKGDFYYIATESPNFNSWFGFSPDITDGSATAINGDDAVELFYDTTKAFSGNELVVDVFGDIDVDGSGQAWEYTDGWAYRKSFTGPDSTSFNPNNWTFSGPGALDGESNNNAASNPFPVGTYEFSMGTPAENEPSIPSTIKLFQNYPNPFNPSTVIRYELANAGFVSLKVYDVMGREVANLVEGSISSGTHSVRFDARNLSSGVYMYQLKFANQTLTSNMLLIK